jgi:di/tricarboxylate transporter
MCQRKRRPGWHNGTSRALSGGVGALPTPQLVFFVILLAAFVLLITEKLRNDVVAVLIVIALAVTRLLSPGLLSPAEALSGFGSEPAIVVAAIFVLSGGLHRTGVAESLGRLIGRWAGDSWARATAVIMPSVALLSAFTHHVTTTAVMLPVTLDLARDKRIPASKLLMPLSFAASLGTTITIIGAPAFLIASESLRQAGRPGLGLFSIAPIGLALSAVGTAFVLLAGKLLLPERKGAETGDDHFRLEEYFTELTVLDDSPFRDKTVQEIEEEKTYDLTVVGVVRQGRRLLGSQAETRVKPGDVLLVRTTPEDIAAIRKEAGVELHPVAQYQPADGAGKKDDDPAEHLVQAVVAPGSELARRTIADVDFRRRYGAIVVGLWRQDGWLTDELSRTRLRPGDVLILQGDDEALARVGAAPGILMMVPFHGEGRVRRKGTLATGIMVLTVLAAAFNVMSLEIAGLAGAVAMVLTGCLTGGQAYRAIDSRIYVFIAGAIPLGLAMKSSGAADTLAGWLQGVMQDWSQPLILLTLFAAVAVVTQFMSDSATTALFAPVAVALAQALDRPPEPYVVSVAMASVVAFLTPIGHHGNLLIYGPGGYRFADFVRVGAPLTALAAGVVIVLAPLLWRG